MVPKEEIPLEGVEVAFSQIKPTELRRNPAGDWTLIFDADAEVKLADGRRVRFYGELRIKGKQYGQRPRKGK